MEAETLAPTVPEQEEEEESMEIDNNGGGPLFAVDNKGQFVVIRDLWNDKNCIFCSKPVIDEMNLGPLLELTTKEYGDIVTHYFCLLFSAGIKQRGKDCEGILGFLPQDIVAEAKRAKRLKCFSCEGYGAALGCCVRSCKKMYHFKCGLEHNYSFEFAKKFRTFCTDHSTPQIITVPEKEWKCQICLLEVTKDEHPIQAMCCNTTVFHKECLQRMAYSAGYFFRCPMCKNDKVFVNEMKMRGIFVPEQDASWERDPNAFRDQQELAQSCDAPQCFCDKGRFYDAQQGRFHFVRCVACGATGAHRMCARITDPASYECKECSAISEKLAQAKEAIDFSKLRLSSLARDYFPHLDLSKFKEELPDWRKKIVWVPVVDWLSGAVEDKDLALLACQKNNGERSKLSKSKRTAAVAPKKKRPKSKSRSKRISKWSVGITHKSKKSKKPKKPNLRTETVTKAEDCNNETSVNEMMLVDHGDVDVNTADLSPLTSESPTKNLQSKLESQDMEVGVGVEPLPSSLLQLP